MIEGCTVKANPDYRLLLSNVDLGVPLMAQDLQAGLDFQVRPPELFEGKEMGEDALRLLGEYRKLLKGVREIIDQEHKVLKESLRWGKTLKFLQTAPTMGIQLTSGFKNNKFNRCHLPLIKKRC